MRPGDELMTQIGGERKGRIYTSTSVWSAERERQGVVRRCILDVEVLEIGAASHEVHGFVRLDVFQPCASHYQHSSKSARMHAAEIARECAPSPTLSPTDPVPRGLLTLCPAPTDPVPRA